VTTRERENVLRPIRIPIDFGLIGWRVLLVHSGDEKRFGGVESAADLAEMTAGQGHDWPDVAVLRDDGLRVATNDTYEGLFEMLARGRIDYFPRSISEALLERENHAKLPIEIEPTLLVHYPFALYFFVHPGNEALAGALERGLERALADGSMKTRFLAEYSDEIAALHLTARRRVELGNAELPEQTPLSRRELWFDPVALR
jgi:hypothetical protein